MQVLRYPPFFRAEMELLLTIKFCCVLARADYFVLITAGHSKIQFAYCNEALERPSTSMKAASVRFVKAVLLSSRYETRASTFLGEA